jgi:hypothetical protein
MEVKETQASPEYSKIDTNNSEKNQSVQADSAKIESTEHEDLWYYSYDNDKRYSSCSCSSFQETVGHFSKKVLDYCCLPPSP